MRAFPVRSTLLGLAALVGLAGFVTIAGTVAADRAHARQFPVKVRALYRITFAGFDLGRFEFTSNVNGNGYSLSGRASISAIFGAFKWRGETRSSGRFTGAGPKPLKYAFAFKSNSKRGRIDMQRPANVQPAVWKVSAEPPIRPSRKRVPVRAHHLTKALDPLSAVMALTVARRGVRGTNPCRRRIPIFDGKQRFDLVLSHKKTVRLEGVRSRGISRSAYVCRVRYVPIAGHKMNKETKYMARTTGIEVWMMPVPRANLFVPYYIAIPTVAGYAALTSERIDINTPGGGRIALGR